MKELEQRADTICRQLVDRGARSWSAAAAFLNEDYLVAVVHELDAPESAKALMAAHGE